MARSAVNMWIRDRLEVDSRFTQSPKQYIRELEHSIERLHPVQRTEAVEYARQYSALYYGDRHKGTPVPHRVTERIERLAHRAERADQFDRASAFVAKYGSPEKALATFMRAPEKTRETKTRIPEADRPTSMRSHDVKWMQYRGPIHEMPQPLLDKAKESYEKWDNKDKYTFVEYVQYTQKQWQKSPVERGVEKPAKQQERSLEVELSR